MLLIENGTVYTPEQVIPNGAVLVDGDRIAAVGRSDELAVPAGTERINAHGGNIAPGYINMHVHGIAGKGAMDGKSESLLAMSDHLGRHGVTSFLASTSTAQVEVIVAGLAAGKQAMELPMPGAELLGMHLEGPYLSPNERGAHPVAFLRSPADQDPDQYLAYADVLRMVTLAPELPGALELTRRLAALGIVIAAGHSIAIDTEVTAAVEAGLSHATHLFGNMGLLRRVNLRRVAGMVESALLDDRITVELITDGYHISPSLMQLALKIKGTGRIAIITDGSELTGMAPGHYQVFGMDVVLEKEITYVADRSAYAGSVATMDQCVRRAREAMDLSLSETLRMATLTPARILHVDDRKGSLAAGKDADIVVLDTDLGVTQTIARGRVLPVH
jgi:N-acetylglucosamine-6-phosphate deacetylase